MVSIQLAVGLMFSSVRTSPAATNEAIRDWVTNVETTHYLLGSALGPHPYPRLVRDFQRVIGDEAREQILSAEGGLPDALIACVGGGSNAIGLFADGTYGNYATEGPFATGLFYGGGFDQLIAQAIGAATVLAWAFVLGYPVNFSLA